MFNALKMGALLLLILSALALAMYAAPVVDQVKAEQPPALSFMAPGDEMSPPAAVNPAFESSVFMILQLPYAFPAVSSATVDPLAVLFRHTAQPLGLVQIAMIYNENRNAIAAKLWPSTSTAANARGLDNLKYI